MAKIRTCPKWLISGIHEAGYYVYAYEAGTTTLKDTYTDDTESVANTNPIILNARGEADIWWAGTYKVVVYTGDKDVDGVLVWSFDNYGEGENQISTGEFNLVKNGSFETDEVSTGEPDEWTIVDYSTGVHSIDNTDQYHGLNSLKFTSVGAGGGYATSEYFEVREAKEIYADWVMRSSVATVRNVVDIIWYTSAKTAISTTNIYDDSTTNPTAWTEKIGQGTPPSTARYAQIRVYGCHSSDATAGSTWFDDIEISALQAATTTRKGIAEIATQAEVDAGTDAEKYVTPETLRARGVLRNKVIDIGDWDMDANTFVTVAHGVTRNNIRSVSAIIRDDFGVNYIGFPTASYGGTSIEYIEMTASNITLYRGTAGSFDSTNYDSTSYNRGWITIQYID